MKLAMRAGSARETEAELDRLKATLAAMRAELEATLAGARPVAARVREALTQERPPPRRMNGHHDP